MKKFYIFLIFLIIVFIILGFFAIRFSKNLLNRFEYLDKLDNEDFKKEETDKK